MAGSAAHPLPEQQRYECDYEIPVGARREPPRLPRENVLVIDNLAWEMRDKEHRYFIKVHKPPHARGCAIYVDLRVWDRLAFQ